MKKSDCSITTFENNPNVQRGLAVKVYNKKTKITYIYYGHYPRLIQFSEDLPSYYHPTAFTISTVKKFIAELGGEL